MSLLFQQIYFNFAQIAAMENPNKEINVYLESEKQAPIPLETAQWLRKNSITLANMEADLGDHFSDIYIPNLTSEQFLPLNNLITRYDVNVDNTNSNDLLFAKLCKKPTIKSLTDLFNIAHFLDIPKFQESIITEIALRYYTYPSLAKRHTNNKLPIKYTPSFNTKIETAVAQKVVELSQKKALVNKIQSLNQMSENAFQIQLTQDRKQIIGTTNSNGRDISIWDSATGKLLQNSTHSEYEVVLVASINEPQIFTWNGGGKCSIKHLQGCLIREWKRGKRNLLLTFRNLYKPDSIVVTPSNLIVICNRNKIGFITLETDEKGVNREMVNEIAINWNDDRYCVAFPNYPCITNDGKFLIFKYRCGVKKLNLADDSIECFDFISPSKLNDEVSAIALSPDNSQIIVGVCYSTCKTEIKILDFNSGTINKTIDINAEACCYATHELPPEKEWPFEYISSIVPTPDGTKIIVSSKKILPRIIDLNTGTLVNELDIETGTTVLGVTPDATKIIVGPRPLSIYGYLTHESIAKCLEKPKPLQNILKILAGMTKSNEPSPENIKPKEQQQRTSIMNTLIGYPQATLLYICKTLRMC